MAGQIRRDLYLQVSANTDPMARALKAGKSTLAEFGAAAESQAQQISDAYAKLGGSNVAESARAMEQAYAKAFAGIRANARAVLDAPNGQAAVQVINVAGAEQAAATAEMQAAALRQVATAAEAAAAATNDASSAESIYALAARSVAIGAEEQAVALRGQATALQRVQSQLAITADAAEPVIASHTRMGASGMILQHVVRSTSDSFAAGLPPTMIFAEQIGRLGEAVAIDADRFGKFGAIMGGPWGIAITAGIGIAATLATTLLAGEDAAKKDATAHDLLKEAIDRLNGAQAALNHTTEQGIIDDINAARGTRDRAKATLDLARAELVRARGLQSIEPSKGANASVNSDDAGISVADNRVVAALADIDAASKALDAAEKPLAVARGRLIDRRALAALDPRSAITQRYDDRINQLERDFEAGKFGSTDDAAAVRRNYLGRLSAGRERDAALAALQTPHERRQRQTRTVDPQRSISRAANDDRSYQSQLDQAQRGYAEALLALNDTAEGRLKIDLQSLEASKTQRDLEIDDLVTAKKISPAEADKLKHLNAATTELKEEAAVRQEQSRLLHEQLDRDRAELDGQIAVLEMQSELAVTRKERLRIAHEILDRERQEALRAQQAIIADPTSTQAQRDAATKQQGRINDQFDLRGKVTDRQNADPLQQYFDKIKANTADMNDALKGVAADGLQSLEDGLVGIISGTESVGEAFKRMAASIIADLARIAIEKAIVSAAVSIFGLSDGGVSLGGGSLPGHAHGLIPGFAGGRIVGPGTGTSDSILAILDGKGLIRVSNGESIMTAEATRRHAPLLKAMNDNRLPGFSGGLVDPSAIRMAQLPRDTGALAHAGGIALHIDASIHAPGADAAALARVEAKQQELERSMPGIAVQAVAEARSRFVLRG